MEEVKFYGLNLRKDLKCDFENEINVYECYKKINNLKYNMMIFEYDSYDTFKEIFSNTKFKRVGDIYYNEEIGLYFEITSLYPMPTKRVLERMIEEKYYDNDGFFDEIKEINNKDKSYVGYAHLILLKNGIRYTK